jgi:hypothetical protein
MEAKIKVSIISPEQLASPAVGKMGNWKFAPPVQCSVLASPF